MFHSKRTRFLLGSLLGGSMLLTACTPTTTSAPPSASPTQSPGESAAGGPLSNHSLALTEAACAEKEVNPPWYSTMLGYEHHDSTRSKMYPCAQFTGSLTDPNNIYAYKSPDNFYAPSMMATRGVNEMYLYGGSLGNANPLPSGPYVARVEPGSLKELWRTNLLNTHIGNQWIGAGSIESIDGDVLAIVNTYLFKIDGTTGAVKKVVSLPTIGSAPEDSYFNGMDGWSDGTLVMKNLARVPGCKEQGFFAVVNCPNLEKTPPSTMVVVNSKNLAVLASKQMEQMIGGRITAAEFNGKKYAYVAGPTKLYRYLWDGKNISLDTSWGPVSYLQSGETGASAVSILGDQVLLMTNGGAPTQTPLSIVAISQSDATKIHRIQPMPLQQGQISYIPSALSVDAVNNRLYTMDPGPGKVAAVDINPQTGEMKLAWSVDQSTLSWMVLIGPPDKRVLVATDIKTNTSMPNPLDWQSGPIGANYTERVQWRQASTGKLLGQSDYYSPMVVGMQLWPGYGGLIYDGLTDGGLVAFQPLPSPPATPSPTPSPSPSPSPKG